MEKIVTLEGADLHAFLAHMAGIVNAGEATPVYRLRFWIDGDEGIKFKVNEYSWSPGRGVVKNA